MQSSSLSSIKAFTSTTNNFNNTPMQNTASPRTVPTPRFNTTTHDTTVASSLITMDNIQLALSSTTFNFPQPSGPRPSSLTQDSNSSVITPTTPAYTNEELLGTIYLKPGDDILKKPTRRGRVTAETLYGIRLFNQTPHPILTNQEFSQKWQGLSLEDKMPFINEAHCIAEQKSLSGRGRGGHVKR
ncbi:hypothetical protein P691DRAFT_763440 [Macrolepiota fuliginosa MF-IS2]|uniref:Uncharacterized protein n=1 Tax=Macrolepiota fuliginosa MF-IS2 TaxID=1400762 RepID=A0A9P6C096_9AGAR|nr:hypothetical protein P691DRAFT_763440 [Macrolepiota fuliginosa MF-IS2]